jgi:opacity protein-like surface antigen
MTLGMQKKIFAAVSLFICSTYTNFAHAQELPIYLKLESGFSSPQGKLHNYYDKKKLSRGEFYGAGIGYDFKNSLRADLVISHRTAYKFNSVDEELHARQSFTNTSLMANLYYDLPTLANYFTPYFNVGIGVARNKSSRYSNIDLSAPARQIIASPQTQYNAAMSAGAGINIALRPNIKVDIFCRYNELGAFKTAHYKMLEDRSRDYRISPGKLKTVELGIGLSYYL